MLLGFNMLLWASQLGEEHFPMLARIKAAGYDGVELPLFGGTPADYARVGRELRDNGLRATAVCVIPDRDHDCTSAPTRAVRAAGLDHLKWAIDCLEAAGGEVLCGPCYQPLGIFSGAPPTAEERSGIVEVHKAAARHAAEAGHQARGRAAQPLRVLRAQHRRRRRRDRPPRRRAELRPSLRHLPRQHRGEGPGRGDRRAHRGDHPRPRLGERPRHPRQGPRAVGGDLQGAQGAAAMTAGS